MRAEMSAQNHDKKKTKAQLIAELDELRRERMQGDSIEMDGKLRLSVAELNAILDVADDAIISMDEDYRIRMFNEGAAIIFGFSPEEVIGQSVDMLLPEELRDIHRLHVEKFAKDNKRARLMGERSEVAGVRKNGERFPADASISKIHMEGKTVFTVILRDISRQKYAEQALRESESLLQLIADTLPANIVYVDAGEKYKFVNKTYTDWMRLSKEEVIGKHLTEIVAPEAYKMIKPHLEDALAGNRVDYEGKFTFPDEITRDFHASYVPTFESDGTVNGFAGLIEDITDRKQAEKKLWDSEEHFRSVISNAPLVIWSLDKEGVFTLSEGKGLRRMGLRPGEMVGQSVFESYKDFPNIIADHERAFAGETLTGTAQFGDLHFETYISPVLDARGNVERVIGVAIDISDRVQVEEEFRASQRLLQTVFDAVPHWIYVKDTEARYILANRSMSSDIDTGGKEIVGMHTLQLNTGSEENVKDFLISDRQVIDSGNRIDISPYEMILADGRRSVRQAVKVPLRDAEGKIIGLVGVSEDITDRRQVEEALRESEERFRAIFNNSPLVIFLMNRDGRYIMVNRQFENWHRVSSNDMIGETHHKVFPSKFADGHAAQDQKVIDSGMAIVWEVEVEMNDGVKR